MPEAVAHLVGDYILQTHWMATNKTKSTLVALIHAAFYTLPFLLLTQSFYALAVIMLTHAAIDRYRIALHLTRLKNWTWTETGYPEGTPPFLTVWLTIIVDNTLHLVINHFAIHGMTS